MWMFKFNKSKLRIDTENRECYESKTLVRKDSLIVLDEYLRLRERILNLNFFLKYDKIK